MVLKIQKQKELLSSGRLQQHQFVMRFSGLMLLWEV